MKRKFFVNFELGIFIEVFMLILMIVCACFLIFLPTKTPLNEDITLLIVLIIMLFVMPSLIMTMILFVCFPAIEADEEKITKKLFGIKIKSFSWEDIKYVQFKGQFKQWLFLSKTDLTKKFLSSARCRRDNIYFFVTQSKLKKIMQVVPEFIKQNLEVKTSK